MTHSPLASLHDGHLLAIAIEDDKTITLLCRSLAGTKVTIRLNDVVDFCANDFRQGNIILSAEIRPSVEALDASTLRRLAHSDRAEDALAYRDRMRAKEAAGVPLRYFELLASYGCDLVGACRGEIVVQSGT
jgi:hypothetical protein